MQHTAGVTRVRRTTDRSTPECPSTDRAATAGRARFTVRERVSESAHAHAHARRFAVCDRTRRCVLARDVASAETRRAYMYVRATARDESFRPDREINFVSHRAVRGVRTPETRDSRYTSDESPRESDRAVERRRDSRYADGCVVYPVHASIDEIRITIRYIV